MRIPPNHHPVIRLRNTLLTATSLFALWVLLCLASCGLPPAVATRQRLPVPDRLAATPGPHGLRESVTRFAPMGPIPLSKPFAPMHATTRLWV